MNPQLIAQATDSVLVTDSSTRWQELISAQHRAQRVVTYPWNNANSQFNVLPIDELFLDTFKKSQGDFAIARNWLKATDQIVLGNNSNSAQLTRIASRARDSINRLEQVSEPLRLASLRILSPEGGLYDANVQRLLTRSSCLRYDRYVRSL